MRRLLWRQVVPTEVLLQAPIRKYQDDQPLSDIFVAGNGAVSAPAVCPTPPRCSSGLRG